MSFVQVIEFRTSRYDEMRAVAERWEQEAGESATARRRILCQDRDEPGHYFNIVFFDSYESAMQNSTLPETGRFSKEMFALADGEPTFRNLEVVEDRTL